MLWVVTDQKNAVTITVSTVTAIMENAFVVLVIPSIQNCISISCNFNQLFVLVSFFQVGTVRCATSAFGYQVASKGPASNLINAFAIRNIMAHYAITKVSQSVLIRCQIFDHFSCCRLRVHRRARRF